MDFDAIVIGGGHAGIEAAMALSRLNYRTLMITQNLDTIGKMSCNPAVGGLAKGNMVREIDALGGQMGKLIDATMIQFRVLNRRKGPAVQSPRAQADKVKYQLLAKQTLEAQAGLQLFMDTVVDFLVEEDGLGPASGAAGSNGGRLVAATDPALAGSAEAGMKAGRRIAGVVTERGKRFTARTVVLTTGTFLNGKIFIGEHTAQAGRLGEPAALGLERALKGLGFAMGRMKTGTPARVHADSIDFSKTEPQWGDEDVIPFSFSHDVEAVKRPQLPCYITYTSDTTHQVIRDNMHRSPLYSGKIEGIGPRYCPSIEDKVVKFPNRERHQIFLEPEGADTKEIYLNGMSSSLPEDVQEKFIHTLRGLEEAVIMRPGYAVEYDFMDPSQLFPSLETKAVRGLFVAGQTNGTSGYEEAAAQGIVAGINAGRYLAGEEPVILSRAEAYIGVLVDDLVTLGTKEPYRMFTSRAEHRISLRHDSSDSRLFEKAYRLGMHSEESWERFETKREGIEEIKELLRQRRVGEADMTRWAEVAEAKVQSENGLTANAEEASAENGAFNNTYRERTLGKTFMHVLKSPNVSIDQLRAIYPDAFAGKPVEWLRQVELDVKYEGYVARQEQQILRFNKMESMKIPADFDFNGIFGLSNESREKFNKIRPLSIGQAGRISGVRNSDLAILMVSVARRPQQNGTDAALSAEFLDASRMRDLGGAPEDYKVVPVSGSDQAAAEAFIGANRVEMQQRGEEDGE